MVSLRVCRRLVSSIGGSSKTVGGSFAVVPLLDAPPGDPSRKIVYASSISELLSTATPKA
jgi:hypothetical protein